MDIKKYWLRLNTINELKDSKFHNDFKINFDQLTFIREEEGIVIIPLNVMLRSPEGTEIQQSVIFILEPTRLISIVNIPQFSLFEKAAARIARLDQGYEDPRAIFRLLLRTLNEECSNAITLIGESLETTAQKITKISGHFASDHKVLAASDIADIMANLNQKEESVSRCLESQLGLARAARYLDEEILDSEIDLQSLVRGLREDINGVKEHALFEHEKIEYLQNAILAALNINQNQIVKVFTVITAVFLPPTLVATLYGMNFQKMPEYALEHGFLIAILLTLISAVVPLLYIKRKRWLR